MRPRKHFSQTHSRVCYFKINISVRGTEARVFTKVLCHFAERTGIYFMTLNVRRVFTQLQCTTPNVQCRSQRHILSTCVHHFLLFLKFHKPLIWVFQSPLILFMHHTLEIERHLSFFEGISLKGPAWEYFSPFISALSIQCVFYCCYDLSPVFKEHLSNQNPTNWMWTWLPSQRRDTAYHLRQTALRIRCDVMHLKKNCNKVQQRQQTICLSLYLSNHQCCVNTAASAN